MKISWGIKITVLYGGFVMLILGMVNGAMRQKVDLVSKDYYEQELKYQDRINRKNKAATLQEPLTWEITPGALILKFPTCFKGRNIRANVHFFRPSDLRLDKIVSLVPDTSGIKKIETGQLKRGTYTMRINWEVDRDEYYDEGVIQIN
jgi:hypothetical protein